MSRAVNPKQKEEDPAGEEKKPLTLVEFPTPETPWLDEAEESLNEVRIAYDGMGMAQFERGSLLRVFRREFRRYAHYLMSDRGGNHPLEEACRLASLRYDRKGAAELMEELLNTPVESVGFSRLKDLWECSPQEAERYLVLVKTEAQREFSSGHLAAEVFEPVDWMNSVWQRARFIAIRDTFLAEYKPKGGIEYALIDTLTQAHFMQQYWMETAVKRTRSDPRRESYEYTEWKHYKHEMAKARKFDPGYWDIPYVSEVAAVENATQMADTFARLFQRALRQLNAHRLAKLKAEKLKAEIRRLNQKRPRGREQAMKEPEESPD